jgi:alpha-glucosidase
MIVMGISGRVIDWQSSREVLMVLRLAHVSVVFLVLLATALSLSAGSVSSPDRRIVVTVDVKENPAPYVPGKRLYYSVMFEGKPLLLDSAFQIDFKGMPSIATDLRIMGERRRAIRETWKPTYGTTSLISNNANELSLSLTETSAPGRKLNFVVRAFNDGVAFRYELPKQPAMGGFKLAAEKTEFRFDGNKTAWAADHGKFVSSQESQYRKITLDQIKPGSLIGCPLLVQAGPAWVALTEANLTDWAGMWMTGIANAPNAVMTVLPPHPDERDVAVISQTPRHSPWRTIMIGARPGDLIESNIIQNLNEPSVIKDTSWIRPGVSAWDRWWSDSYGPDFNGKIGMGTDSMKYFVDLASEMKWQYQLVDWTWYGEPFEAGKPQGEAGNPAADLAVAVPELNIAELVRYARQKNVRIWLWMEWDNANKQMERVFPMYEQWGIAGVKVDFMNRDDQVMVNFYERFARLAARHHLMVDFHGAYKPTGAERTYPNILTREGVLGNEYNKWSTSVTPTHKVTLPFTRMITGPMDFTPGGFRNRTVKTFRQRGGGSPQVMGTRANELAMLVVYYSPLQVLCDSPYNYRNSPSGLNFLKAIPTVWDRTKVIDGSPGEFVVVARQSGGDWYLGGMNGDTERSVEIPLSFLGSGRYKAQIYADGPSTADNPELVAETEVLVRSTGKLIAAMLPGGGYAVKFTPVQ